MDWLAIARVLGERSALPTAVLDSSGTIRLLNRAMERALGWTRYETEGKRWEQVFAAAEDGSHENWWIDEALSGSLHNCDIVLAGRSGARLRLSLEFALTGKGEEQGLLITARKVVPAPIFQSPIQGRDIDYDVQAGGPNFGRLSRLCSEGESLPLSPPHVVCYTALHQRPTPCPDCPLLQTGQEPNWPTLTVRRRRVQTSNGAVSQFELVTAVPIDDSTVRLRVRTISEDTLGAIHQAKLDHVADQSKLTARERQVLRYLILGRSLQDIATILNISERTVKYHQANVIEKVGADSRADLVRFIF